MKSGASLRRATLGVLTAALLVAGSAVVAGTPAQAAQGIAESGRARFVVSAVGKPVQVEQLLYLTNLTPPTSQGATVRTGYALWLPDGESGIRATSSGVSLPVSVVRTGGEQFARITFPEPLRYGYSRDVRVTYTIKGGA